MKIINLIVKKNGRIAKSEWYNADQLFELYSKTKQYNDLTKFSLANLFRVVFTPRKYADTIQAGFKQFIGFLFSKDKKGNNKVDIEKIVPEYDKMISNE